MMTLHDRLDQWNSDTLKDYVKLLGGDSSITRKADRIEFICKRMLDQAALKKVWERLDPIAQRAVSTAYHNGGEFNASAFINQYGQLPPRPQEDRRLYYYNKTPILFDIFVVDNQIPEDLMPLLENLVLPVERFQLEGIEKTPIAVETEDYSSPVITVETELTGRADLLTYLRMVELSQAKLSQTNHRLTAASVRKLLSNLLDGDFRELPEKVTGRNTIRPFGLDVFTQEAGLVSSYSGKLTEPGREYLHTQDSNILLDAFEKWVENKGFDELQRIDQLRGVGSNRTSLTPPGFRRGKVIEALSWCPVGVWINITDFYRALIIWDFDFDVEETYYSNLHVGSSYYGELYGNTYWAVTRGLYINAIIWEYLATLGAVDIAFAEDEYFTLLPLGDLYIDDPVSAYDSLLYFRINKWGAYLLGQADNYIPGQPRKKERFRIDEQRRLHLLDDLPPAAQLQLETLADQVDDQIYQLDTAKILTAVENGQSLEQISAFLKDSHQGDLPPTVSDWLSQLDRNQSAFKGLGEALLVQLKQPGLADLINEDEILPKLCQRLDNKTILIRISLLRRFQNRLKELGYLFTPK